MKNKIEDLRNHLFEALERLNDDEIIKDQESLDKEVKRSEAITQISNSIIMSAKVEVMFLKVTDKNTPDTMFFKTIGDGK